VGPLESQQLQQVPQRIKITTPKTSLLLVVGVVVVMDKLLLRRCLELLRRSDTELSQTG
jgi:hypothetical protein